MKQVKFESIILIIIVLFTSSCSKMEEAPILHQNNNPTTGISFRNAPGAEVDFVEFEIKRTYSESEFYSQSTRTHFNTLDLQEGNYLIFNVKAFSDGAEVDYNFYTIEDGEERFISGTSVLKIDENTIKPIYITKIIL